MTSEKTFSPLPGALMLFLLLASVGLSIYGIIDAGRSLSLKDTSVVPQLIGSIVALGVIFVCLFGFFVVEPNGSKVLLLFGTYKGTVKKNGFFWTNPFMSKRPVSLRARNLEGEKLKVNELHGNPIDISIVVVWRVANTAQALFDVDHYEDYVSTQSEAAVRQLAGTYSYDNHDDSGEATDGISLREGREQINEVMEAQLSERLARAGVEVIEARITHLAYSPEIAGAMLQRQQAAAMVAARRQIVNGAVGMVQMALEKLEDMKVIQLDDERKAAMVSNLLVVLCGDRNPQPVVNTGTLYH
ncbi:MAG TPA: SPFH domain-containing protein [Planctomycetota bacterium]|nr:SPFH domain-containing protein [Planctomycetota bacterium]